MRVLALALQRALAGPARELLARLERRPWLAALGGALATALLQSSSVTTLVIAGLADARLLSLGAAAGAVIGANVGTTLTAYLTALDPLRAAPWLLVGGTAGLVLAAVPGVRRRSPRLAALSAAAFGFGAALAGLRGIEAAAQPLAGRPAWEAHLRAVADHPLAGLAAGIVMTTVLDSSSAAIAVLQRLVEHGLLPLAAAIPVLLGDNIGTTTATLAASLALGPYGRRAALVHLTFNAAGVLLWWPRRDVLAAVAGAGGASPAAGLARAHLTFNVTGALVQLPLLGLHLALAARVFPDPRGR